VGCGIADGDSWNGQHTGAPSFTLSGLSGVKAASTISALTSSETALNGLTPTYSAASGELVFTPSSDLALGSFSVSFDIVNQESANTPGTNALSLQPSYVEMSGGAAAAVTDATGNSQPFYILGPVIEASSSAWQSSDEPCAVNTIAVTLTTNVPLYFACTPKITLSGLTSSSSDSLSDITSVVLVDAGSTSVTAESWTRETGTLILAPNGYVPQNFAVRFTLINPSYHQNAPGMTVGIQYSGAYDFVSNFPACTGCTSPDYPMKIRNAVISSSIIQSSPFPCDQNTITVTVSADVTLQARCDPQITLQGLSGSATGDGNIDVTVDDGSTTSTRTGAWTAAGTLTLGYLNSGATIAANQEVTLSFQLTNPQTAPATTPSTSLSVSLDDAFHEPSTHAVAVMGLYQASALAGPAWDDRMGSTCPPEVSAIFLFTLAFEVMAIDKTFVCVAGR